MGGTINVSQAAPIGCGQSLSWSITDPSAYGGSVSAPYDFVGNAGERVLLNVHTSSGAGALAFFIDPDGQQWIAWDGGFEYPTPKLLSQTGTCLIYVVASGQGPTTFDLSLMIIGREGCSRSITCGQTLSGSIDTASKMEAYTFSGEAKEAVLASRGMIIDPNGSLLGSANPDRIFQLATTGTYTIVVNYSGAGSLSIGQTPGFSYDIILQFTTGRCAPRINCGETAGGDIGPLKSDLDAWKFDADAKERIVLYSSMIATTSGYFYPQWDLYDPHGNLFTSLASGRETPEYSIALPLTGTYTIMVKAQQQAGTGSYDIGLQFTSGRCALPIDCGQTRRGSIRTRTELVAYKFQGTAKEAVIFPIYGVDATMPGDSSKVIGLFGPKGEYLTYNWWSGFALPESGDYVIIVGAKNQNGTGDYDLMLQYTTGHCAATITCGQTHTRAISSRHQLDAFKFSGTAGKEVSLWPEEEPLSLYTNVDVFSPAGSYLGNFNNPKGFFTPSVSGTLTAVVSHSDDRINSYRFFLGCEGVCAFFLAEVKTSFPASGGVGSALVVTGVDPNRTDECCWTSSSDVQWIRFVSGASRCTTWSPAWEVDPNPGPQRRGTLTIAGQSFAVTQAGAGSCSYSISPTSRSHGAGTETGSVSVTATSGCSWTATSNSSWITITSGNSGSGNGTVSYSVAANTSGSARTGTLTIAGQTFTVTQQVLYAGATLAVGLGRFGTNGGWVSTHAGKDGGFALQSWLHLPWSAYNATGGGVHVAVGDVDGDGLDEIVMGLGTGGGGRIAIFDDSAHAYALLKSIQVSWDAYNASNGEVFPAVGDIDGDGRAEIIAGLGTGSQGWIEIFGNALTGYDHRAWRQVAWPAYSAADGTTHPAVGDLDGDGKAEIVLGLGSGGGGWIEVLQSSAGDYNHGSWLQVGWPAYNASNGTTWPAVGDIDGDGRAEIIIGLGQGSGGWVEFLDDKAANYARLRWFQIPWDAYDNANGETHPAVGNLDADLRAEIVFGLGRYQGQGGWLFAIDDATSNYATLGSFQIPWNAFAQDGGETFPAIGRPQ
jgi:hypothetical protein